MQVKITESGGVFLSETVCPSLYACPFSVTSTGIEEAALLVVLL